MQRKLEGRSLELGREIDKAFEDGVKYREKLHKEAAKAWEVYRVESKQKVDKLIEELGALENIDMKEYALDGTYFDEHGLMFIVDNPDEDEDMSGLQNMVAEAMKSAR